MDSQTVQRSALCRFWPELSNDPNSNEYLLAKIGFDTAENEPCKVCPLSAYRSPRFLDAHHCPGSVIVVLELHDGVVVHTGDFRFHPQVLEHPVLARAVQKGALGC